MSSIGPQLPPKRKRDNPDSSSPPPKHPRNSPPANEDEIDLDSDSDDSFGPAAPPSASNSRTGAGAGVTKPPSAATVSQPAAPEAPAARPPADSSSDSEDDYGPALPSSKPTIGPAMPPAPSAADEQQPQRDDWMLAPPTSTSYTERDPTKLRARKFASKPSTSSTTQDSTISSIWTETPEQKLQRLQDSVLGRSSSSTNANSANAHNSSKSKEERERERRIAENVEKTRGKSMVEEHQGKRRQEGRMEEGEDDPSKRAFDREKDMALGGRLGGKEKRELMSKAADFGGRFQKGSFL